MKEKPRRKSYKEQLDEMSPDEVRDQMVQHGKKLKEYGIDTQLHSLISLAREIGDDYEDVTNEHGDVLVTPMNMLMAIAHHHLSLLQNRTIGYRIGTTVSRFTMAFNELQAKGIEQEIITRSILAIDGNPEE